MLIVFSGLPGSGKTTLARKLAAGRSATYLRIDSIEHALRKALTGNDIGAAGYDAALAIAGGNLSLGITVVADCVNPVAESRAAWRDVASASAVPHLDIEVVCSDKAEHRRRVEQRQSDITGFTLPDWAAVEAHVYQPWTGDRLVVDTAVLSIEDALRLIETRLTSLARSAD
ncbi:ATP-binding protein [Bosea vestrisii]|uniref:AAA family ATPase n=1 Tax=Bosea vestrisii TaxID=151416 RepID=UPI0024E02234|nr:ATP-binding protein [Bosea vestrisii]WID96487.1 ATP-binding protein [Bosea vestrisii]